MSRQRKPSRQVQVDEQIQVVLALLRGELSHGSSTSMISAPTEAG